MQNGAFLLRGTRRSAWKFVLTLNTEKTANIPRNGKVRMTSLVSKNVPWLASLLAAAVIIGCGTSASASVTPTESPAEASPSNLDESLAFDESQIVEPRLAESGGAVPPGDPAPVVSLDPESAPPPATNPPEADNTCDVAPGPFDRSQFRVPLPATPRWNPPGQKRVGIQAGHWLTEQSPQELRGLGPGASGGGKSEWEVNLNIARRVGALLEAEGIQVDILPTTVPVRYRAHAFVSIHADGDVAGRYSGFKVARPGFSSVPEADDRLVRAINAAYEPATGLARDDDHISLRMLYYYAFNSRRYCHAVSAGRASDHRGSRLPDARW